MLFNFFVVLSFLFVCCCNARTVDTKDYTIWTIPDASSDVSVTGTKSGTAMIGGGSDCIPAFSWLIDHAAGGDFVVLRSGGTDAYNQFVYDLSVSLNKTLNSVSTISFKNRDAAYNDEVLTMIKNAELIFFSGGDQSSYVNFWKGTPVEDIIQDKMKNQVSIGGTSAGLAIQGEYIFTSEVDTVYSDESMDNPYNHFITFTNDFLNIPFLQNTITDTHFSKRDRMGRMLSFLGRLSIGDMDTKGKKVSVSDPTAFYAVALDEETALLLDIDTGKAVTVGNPTAAGHAFICNPTAAPEVCQPDTPLTFTGVQCMRLKASSQDTYDFKSHQGNGVTYTNSIVKGAFTTKPYGP